MFTLLFWWIVVISFFIIFFLYASQALPTHCFLSCLYSSRSLVLGDISGMHSPLSWYQIPLPAAGYFTLQFRLTFPLLPSISPLYSIYGDISVCSWYGIYPYLYTPTQFHLNLSRDDWLSLWKILTFLYIETHETLHLHHMSSFNIVLGKECDHQYQYTIPTI